MASNSNFKMEVVSEIVLFFVLKQLIDNYRFVTGISVLNKLPLTNMYNFISNERAYCTPTSP